jgi:iron(III) transport system permease protein
MILGVTAGIFLWRWNRGFSLYIPWLVLILALIPPYIHALAWTAFFNQLNPILLSYDLPGIMAQGELLAWWVQLMNLAPLAIGLAMIAIKTVSPALVEAGRIQRSDFRCLFRIVLPLIAPLLLAGGGLLFVFSLMDYSIPSLFQVNVYSMEIFVEFSASNEPARAFLLSVPLLAVAVAAILLSRAALKNVTQSSSWHSCILKTPPSWPVWFQYYVYVIIAVITIQILMPLITLVIYSAGVPDITSTIASAGSEIIYTIWISLLSAAICIPLAASLAPELLKTRHTSNLWWIFVIVALAIPPALTGIGLISTWNNSLLPPVYGTPYMPLLAALARFTPLAVIIIAAQLSRIDPLLIDSARILQKNDFQTLLKIWLPLTAPGIIAAAAIVFALTAGELAATLIVAAPGQATLTMRIYNLLHYGATDSVAFLCLIIFISTLAAGAIAVWAFRRNYSAATGETS